MTDLARLKDCFRPQSPERVLGCTYGFQPEFFEQEILPAIFPDELALDRGAGNVASYLQAGDELLVKRPVVICCDHHDAGKTLTYQLIRARTGGAAYHPKLLLLDYGGEIRAIVSSANLTRHAWTSAIELFLFEDLPVGGRHPWAAPLRRFLARTQDVLSPASRHMLDPFVSRLTTIRDSRWYGTRQNRLVSSFDGALLDIVLEGRNVDRAYLVTPFLEGEGGAGVFDRLNEANPDMTGSLFVGAEEADGTPVVRGPAEKLKALLHTGRWELQQVRRYWNGDAEEMPRQLHGKLVALGHGNDVVVLVGSANVTRAGLLMTPPAGNVELGVIFKVSQRDLVRLLPQSDGLSPDEVRFEPGEEEEANGETLADWVDDALYHGATGRLELRLKGGSPPLEVLYGGKRIGDEYARPPSWSHPLTLGRELEVIVRADGSEAVVPFLVLEPELAPPRGLARQLRLEELLDILAGRREVPVDENAGIDEREGQAPTTPGHRRDGDAFAWRRLMRALAGLKRDLIAGIDFPTEVRRLLDGPLGAKGLLEALCELRATPAFQDADYAFAVHELLETIQSTRGSRSKRDERPAESLDHLDRWINLLQVEFRKVRKNADRGLRRQLDLLGGTS